MALPLPTANDDGRHAKIQQLMATASFEVAPHDPLAGAALAELIAPPATVFINFIPGDSHHEIIAAAMRLKAAGFTPVPHVAARCLASFSQLNDFLARAAGEAGVGEALVIAGDPDRPVGPYQGSLDLIETGLFEKHGIGRILVAGYPEGHPKLARPVLAEALRAKLAAARRRGLYAGIVTQFGFGAVPILTWLAALQASDMAVPVRVGLAGPASVATLAKFAVRCGIANTLGALASGHTAVARLLTESGPEPVIAALAASGAVSGLHFYSFGGVRRTAGWLSAAARGTFTLTQDSFRVAP